MSVLQRVAELANDSLPRFAGALLLLVGGLVAVRLVSSLTGKALRAAGVDDHAERLRVHDSLERAGFGRSLARTIELALRVTLTLVVIFAALALLGLAALEQSLNAGVLFLPKLIAAMVIMLVGLVLGGFTREWVERLVGQMSLPPALPTLAEAAVVTVFGVTALAQIGVPTSILAAVVGVIAFAGALTFALAFGLGSRDLAREASAGRYVGGAFRVGQHIGVGGVRGEIVSIEAASTVVESDEGGRVRIPNHMLLDSIVAIDGAPPSEGDRPGARRAAP